MYTLHEASPRGACSGQDTPSHWRVRPSWGITGIRSDLRWILLSGQDTEPPLNPDAVCRELVVG